MSVRIVAPADLGSSEIELWRTFCREKQTFESPYFAPEFTQIVGAVRPSVSVAVLEEAGGPVGFFPFERKSFRRGGPVAWPICDYQGVVHAPGCAFDAEELMRGCGLRVFEFDHLLASQAAFQPFHRVQAESPLIDLTSGFAAYRDWLRRRSSNLVSNVERKARKLAREVGPLRFESASRDPRVLERVLEWKAAQFRNSGKRPVVRLRWVVEVLERIFAAQEPGFAGELCALWAGDDLVAAHFGMRSHRVLHWWFPTYGREFGRYSPGLILLWELLRSLDGGEVRRLDLGKGDDSYKGRFRTDAVWLAEGWVELPSLASRARGLRRSLEVWVRRSPLALRIGRPVLRRMRSVARRMRGD